MVANQLHKKDDQLNNIEDWFDNMVSNLRYDQTLIENNIIEEDKKKFYHAMISGDQDFLYTSARNSSSAYFITNMVDAYIKELIQSKSKPKNIALELSNSKILVWAEIKEDDELMEDALILAEAKINANFSKHGFYISSTIVEDTDALEVPSHYKKVAIT